MQMVHFIPPSQRRLAMLAAEADDVPVLISGGEGTGKGAIAKWVHANSPRAGQALVVANHRKPLGFQLQDAHAGTLLIPEIGEWPLAEQMALLGYFKTHAIPSGPGSDVPRLLNVRVIVTTSQDLDGRAQGGLFNMELLERLGIFRVEMPPLSRRADEFEDIVLGLMGEITRELHKEHLRDVSSETWERLKGYSWPANIRELRNVLRLAVVAARGDRIEASDLPDFGHDRIDLRATREQFERIYLAELLKTYDWQIDKASQASRMEPGVLIAKLDRYGLSRESPTLPQ